MKYFCLFLCCFVFINITEANHISGGYMTYKCLGNNQYKVKTVLYRDCNIINHDITIIPYDNPANFTIHSNNPLTPPQTITAPYNSSNIGSIDVSSSNPCFLAPIACYDSTFYEFTVTLPYDSSGYHIAYQRCCRNNILTNLSTPGQTGMTLSVFISDEAQLSCNNSPTFSAPSKMLVCTNLPLNLDFGAIDSDGDSLVYALCTPLTGATPFSPIPTTASAPPFSTVNYAGNFSANQPFTGNISIHPQTGIITGIVSTMGTYVVAVCVDEYKNGTWMSRITKDILITATNCTSMIVADIQEDYINPNGEYIINTCDTTITIINQSGQLQFINSFLWKFIFSATDSFTSTLMNPTITFPHTGIFKGQLIVNPNTTCSDVAYITVNVIPNSLNADFDYQYDSTIIGPVSFQSILPPSLIPLTQIWDFGDGTIITDSTGYLMHQYADSGHYQVQLTVFDSLCNASITKTISYMPLPILLSDASIYFFEKVQLQPNPVQAQATLTIDSNNSSTINIEIYSSAGQRVFLKEKINILKGTEQITIPMSSLQGGSYFLVLKSGTELQTIPFVKL